MRSLPLPGDPERTAAQLHICWNLWSKYESRATFLSTGFSYFALPWNAIRVHFLFFCWIKCELVMSTAGWYANPSVTLKTVRFLTLFFSIFFRNTNFPNGDFNGRWYFVLSPRWASTLISPEKFQFFRQSYVNGCFVAPDGLILQIIQSSWN